MKYIIVTGTSRGIGKELSLYFAQQGHQVLALSRKISDELVATPGIKCLSVDLTSQTGFDEVKQFVSQNWQRVDVLIHNAGMLVNKPFMELTAADFQEVYQVNVFGVAQLTQAVMPWLGQGSHVVAISSMGGVRGSLKFPGLAAYSSSKGAVQTMMELLAEEYKDNGIRFNVLALGAVQTEMLEEAFPGYQAPLSATEMANYIAKFALEGHAFFNGKVLEVSTSNP